MIPANDDFANATPLTGLGLLVTDLSTIDATFEDGEPEVFDTQYEYNTGIGKTVWFTWSPPVDGDYRISTVGSDFDTVAAIYTYAGGGFSGLSVVYANDDSTEGSWSVLTLEAGVASETYYIQVGGYAGSGGLLSLTATEGLVDPPPPPIDDEADSDWIAVYRPSDDGLSITFAEYISGVWTMLASGSERVIAGSSEPDGFYLNGGIPSGLIPGNTGQLIISDIIGDVPYWGTVSVSYARSDIAPYVLPYTGVLVQFWDGSSFWGFSTSFAFSSPYLPRSIAYKDERFAVLYEGGDIYVSGPNEGDAFSVPWEPWENLYLLTEQMEETTFGAAAHLAVFDGTWVATTIIAVAQEPGAFVYDRTIGIYTAPTTGGEWTLSAQIPIPDLLESVNPIRRFDGGFYLKTSSGSRLFTAETLDGPWTDVSPWQAYGGIRASVAYAEEAGEWLIYSYNDNESFVLRGPNLESLEYESINTPYFANENRAIDPMTDGWEFVLISQEAFYKPDETGGGWGITLS